MAKQEPLKFKLEIDTKEVIEKIDIAQAKVDALKKSIADAIELQEIFNRSHQVPYYPYPVYPMYPPVFYSYAGQQMFETVEEKKQK